MGTLINPSMPTVQQEKDFVSEPVWLRNPQTGMIFGLTHIDTIKRCQAENYLPSSQDAAREQAIELADFHGVPRPSWAPPREGEPVSVPSAEPKPITTEEAPVDALSIHQRNQAARSAFKGR